MHSLTSTRIVAPLCCLKGGGTGERWKTTCLCKCKNTILKIRNRVA